MIYGEENVVKCELQFFSSTRERIDTCMDNSRPSLAIGVKLIRKSFLKAKERGVKLRYLTELTQQNISSCKKVMEFVDELRHMDGLSGDFMVSENEYLAPSFPLDITKPASRLFYSNFKDIVEQQSYFYDTLWKKSTSAEDKIREIEEGTMPIRTRVLQDQDEINKEIINLNNRANRLSICSVFGGMQIATSIFLIHTIKFWIDLEKEKIRGLDG